MENITTNTIKCLSLVVLHKVFNFDISELEWLPWQDASHDLLIALHPPYSIILWNADTGTKLWKKSYTENINSFALDPFCFRNIACRLTFAFDGLWLMILEVTYVLLCRNISSLRILKKKASIARW